VYKILWKFHIGKFYTRPPYLNNVAALPYKQQLIWCCLPVSWPHTLHINWLLTRLLLEKYIITFVNWTLQTRHSRLRWYGYLFCSIPVEYDIYIIITVIHCTQSYFCVSQGGVATLFRWVYNFRCEIFSGFCTPKIIKNRFIFRGIIQNIKGGRVFETV